MVRKSLCRDSNEANQFQQGTVAIIVGVKFESKAEGLSCGGKGQSKSRTESGPEAENDA